MANELIIGRGQQCDVVIKDATVSRVHAKIYCDKYGTTVIEDLNSTNGTYVNGERLISVIALNAGDEIQIGGVVLEPHNYEHYFQSPNSFATSYIGIFRRYGLLIGTLAALLLVTLIFWATDESPESESTAELPAEEAPDSGYVESQPVPEDTSLHKQDSEAAQGHDTVPTENNKPEFKRRNKEISYSVSCLRDRSAIDELIGLGADLQDGFITFTSDEVGVEEEVKVGEALYDQVEKKYGFTQVEALNNRVKAVVARLLNVLKEPRMEYEFWVINDEYANAFTAGGQVFISVQMLEETKNDDELAAILAHEIYHNELGHINKLIRKEQSARNMLGEFAEWGLIADAVAGASFNRENEVYCDLYGVDLAIAAGYDGRAAITFWQRMDSRPAAEADKLFNTHPFSDERIVCLKEHIERNYNVI